MYLAPFLLVGFLLMFGEFLNLLAIQPMIIGKLPPAAAEMRTRGYRMAGKGCKFLGIALFTAPMGAAMALDDSSGTVTGALQVVYRIAGGGLAVAAIGAVLWSASRCLDGVALIRRSGTLTADDPS